MDYGWLSILPPLIAIVLAIITRRVVASLAVAVFISVCILQVYSPPDGTLSFSGLLRAPWLAIEEHLWIALVEGNRLNPVEAIRGAIYGKWDYAGDALSALTKSDHLRVYYFTALFGAMVGVLHASGGMRTLVKNLANRIATRCGGQVLVAFSGLLIFFDDYANTLLAGTTMREPSDRLGISREKLAYLVDSTAAPVAGLALISTWVATEISYMDQGLASIKGNELSAFDLFLQSVPFRFYPIFAIALVFIIAITGRDFGPMLHAESNIDDESDKAVGGNEVLDAGNAPAWTAIATIGTCIGTIIFVLMRTGKFEGEPTDKFVQYWGNYIGNADPYDALIKGGLAGCVIGLILGVVAGKQSIKRLLLGGLEGLKHLLPAMGVLLFAWTLSRLTKPDFLNTQGFLSGWLSQDASAHWLPTIVFVLSAFVAFATGTSWGTMGLLVPLAIPVAAGATSDPTILVAATGAVLAGAIFGDHCSPISDTTVLSSQASGCDHIGHVRTQMPYALLAGAVAILFGTVPASWNVSPWLLIIAGIAAMFAIVRYIGKVPQAAGS